MIDPNLLIDSHGRVLRDLRVSITDRCNFRCLYCLPETEAAHNFYRGRWANLPDSKPIVQQCRTPNQKILSFEEIEQVVRLAGIPGHRQNPADRGRAVAPQRDRGTCHSNFRDTVDQ